MLSVKNYQKIFFYYLYLFNLISKTFDISNYRGSGYKDALIRKFQFGGLNSDI